MLRKLLFNRLDWATDITYWTNTYENHKELKVFLNHLQDGMTVLDIGANVGFYALHFARKVGPQGKVYAFEPIPEYFNRLKEHIVLNNATNIIPVPVALLDQKGVAKMSIICEARGYCYGKYPKAEDYELWCRLAKKSKIRKFA